MCGIFFACSTKHEGTGIDLVAQPLVNAIKDRGPDLYGFNSLTLSIQDSEIQGPQILKIIFGASVLALRGNQVVEQPLRDPTSGSCLCWNGEAWQIGGNLVVQENDAAAVFKLLQSCTAASNDQGLDSSLQVRDALGSIVGPFAFIFLDLPGKRIFYGRDNLGRRSLVTRKDSNGCITVSSVGCGTLGVEWEEVDADGIYEFDLATVVSSDGVLGSSHGKLTPWESVKEAFPPLKRESRPASTAILHEQPHVIGELHQVLRASIATRLNGITFHPCHPYSIEDANLAVLFSGGLDCTILARVIHDLLPPNQPIDLVNVAFENPRLRNQGESLVADNKWFERCPDRITSRAAFQELGVSCPGRTFRLICVNVEYTRTQQCRSQVARLMYPHDTEMDLSIALALYFAASADGWVSVNEVDGVHELSPYKSRARVLFSGFGADELFGGYGRHLVAWKRGGEAELATELDLDFRRIGRRNLGRDDRVTAAWGKEVRYPFLDEDLVTWTLQRPVWEKCDFAGAEAAQVDGQCPDAAKGLLRALARQLGLPHTAEEKKRAIQFGARSAKMGTSKVKGTDKIHIRELEVPYDGKI